MSQFLAAFFPNLASTLLGIVLGVPVALYLNNRLMHEQKRYATGERVRRLDEGLLAISSG